MRITFNELAERELNDAAQYYEHEQSGLGLAFLVEAPRFGVGCSIDSYALLYSVKPEELRILAVMNLKRRPGYWVGRR